MACLSLAKNTINLGCFVLLCRSHTPTLTAQWRSCHRIWAQFKSFRCVSTWLHLKIKYLDLQKGLTWGTQRTASVKADTTDEHLALCLKSFLEKSSDDGKVKSLHPTGMFCFNLITQGLIICTVSKCHPDKSLRACRSWGLPQKFASVLSPSQHPATSLTFYPEPVEVLKDIMFHHCWRARWWMWQPPATCHGPARPNQTLMLVCGEMGFSMSRRKAKLTWSYRLTVSESFCFSWYIV